MSRDSAIAPVALVLDCSGSMAGEAVAALRMGLALLLEELRGDPYAAETAWLCAYTFGSVADLAVWPAPLAEFSPPPLEARGSSALGAALDLLRPGHAADPWPKGCPPARVVLFTDGAPTDRWRDAARRYRAYCPPPALVGVGRGDLAMLEDELGGAVVALRDVVPGQLAALVR